MGELEVGESRRMRVGQPGGVLGGVLGLICLVAGVATLVARVHNGGSFQLNPDPEEHIHDATLSTMMLTQNSYVHPCQGCCDDDAAVQKASEGSASSCAAVAAYCKHKRFGPMVRKVCMRTCFVCIGTPPVPWSEKLRRLL